MQGKAPERNERNFRNKIVAWLSGFSRRLFKRMVPLNEGFLAGTAVCLGTN